MAAGVISHLFHLMICSLLSIKAAATALRLQGLTSGHLGAAPAHQDLTRHLTSRYNPSRRPALHHQPAAGKHGLLLKSIK